MENGWVENTYEIALNQIDRELSLLKEVILCDDNIAKQSNEHAYDPDLEE